MSEQLIAAVDALEEVLCQRYNIKSLSGQGVLAEAIALARVGDLEAIDAAMDGREMYRWRETAEAALADIHAIIEPVPEPESSVPSVDAEEPAPEEKPRSRSKK